MPEPTTDPNLAQIRRVALHALLAGIAIAALKFSIFLTTDSVAVLSDALESLINIAAAGAMLYSIWYSNRPADREHPYGHGKIEFMVVGLEGWLILIAGVMIGYEAIGRFFAPVQPQNLGWGMIALSVVGVLSAALAVYVWRAGRRYRSAPLLADGRHLLTDAVSTVGVFAGLGLVRYTGYIWLDPLVAILMACIILYASWRLLWQSFHGLMDHSDPQDEQAIDEILRDELTQGHIHGYHKVRHRHTGPFHWVDMHLHVDGSLTVAQGHALASRIENRIEQRLGQANATAHLEPYEEQVDAQRQQGLTNQPSPPRPPKALPVTPAETPVHEQPIAGDLAGDDEPDDGRSYPLEPDEHEPRG